MAEINEDDLISAKALKAPYELAEGFEASVVSLTKLIALLKQSGAAIAAADGTSKVTAETKKLAAAESDLDKIKKQITATQAKNNEAYIAEQKALAKVKDELKTKIALGNQEAIQVKAQTASQKELEAALSANRKAYKELTNEEARNSAEGKKLLAVIDQQDKAVKELNESQGKFQDSVGNYDKAKGSLQQLAPATTSAASGFMSMTKAALAFIATPIGLIIAGVAAALYALTAYFKSSEESQNRLAKITAVFSAILEQLMNVVEGVGEAIYDAFSDPKQAAEDLYNFFKDKFVNVFTGMLELIPNIGKAIGLLFEGKFQEASKVAFDAVAKVTLGVEGASDKIVNLITETGKLVDEGIAYGEKIAAYTAKIDKDERALIVERAETNLKVAKLREAAVKLEGEAKRKAIVESIALEKQLSEKEVAYAKLRLSLAETKRDANGDDKEALKEVAEAQAAVYDAEKAAFDNTLKFNKQLESLNAKDDSAAKARADLAKRNADAEYEIEKLRIQRRIDGAATIEERVQAQYALEELAGQHALEKDKLTDKEKEAIEVQTALNIYNIRKKGVEDKTKLQEQEIKDYIAARQLELEGEVAVIKDKANKGLITREQADASILEAKKANGILLIQETLDQQLKILEIESLTAEERKKVEAEVEATKIKLIDATYEANKVKDEDEIAAAAKKLQAIQGIYQNFASAVKDIIDIGSQKRIAAIDAEEKALDEQTKKELQAAGDNQAAKDAIQKQADAKHAVLERRRIDELRKQASFEKKQGIISAGIATALAVLNALSTVKPYPLAVIAAISAGIAGAAQIAAIASKPLPAYEHGTRSAIGGLSLVGEAGMEMLRSPSGAIGFTPNGPTVMDIASGTEVIPHDETMRRLAAASMVADGGSRGSREDVMLNKQLLQGLEKVNSSIQNIQFPDLISSGATVFKSMLSAKKRNRVIRGFNMGKWL